jgi:hypothetical protein
LAETLSVILLNFRARVFVFHQRRQQATNASVGEHRQVVRGVNISRVRNAPETGGASLCSPNRIEFEN